MSRDRPIRAAEGITVGVTKLAWMFDWSRDKAERLLSQWWEEQQAGGPVRVVRMGRRNLLYTTMPVIHAHLPPGRDLELYRRMKEVENGVEEATRRLDVEIQERKRGELELHRRIDVVRRKAS